MKVLSLFDGISCGRVALERIGIHVDAYYASEIDKYAIQVAQKNYPDTIQIGDVCRVDFSKYIDKIDLIIGGSPCQGFSFAQKHNINKYTLNCKLSQGNLLEMDLSSLKMESIVEISDSQRYKMLGNGWTVDVIAHIFGGLK